ncbi:diguanylate cyclase [Nocardioides sp.]|uniref:GGDEF domain-containing protein n=1 Tax=Nocardioides sp. TaxID=35761 RepID=UPI0026216DCD|nr:diguanylate cyclase [Nocardioides sp.]
MARPRYGPQAAFGIAFAILLIACYVGILARMSNHLSAFWPANAVLAGIMLRYPGLNRLSGWCGAFIAYMTADLSTGGAFWVTFGLSVTNMTGAFAVVATARGWNRRRQCLDEPRDVLTLGGACVAGATAAMVAGVPCSMIAFDTTVADAARSWFAGELAEYLAVLPVILTAPTLAELRTAPAQSRRARLHRLAPLIALPLAIALGVWIGGPMALMIVLPLLLWSALRGDVFQTAVLSLLATGWNLVALGSNVTEVESFGTASELSVKVGLALLAAGPLAVAVAVSSREEALDQVRHLARHDSLTGLLNRRAFLDAAEEIVRQARAASTTASVFMVDLDHFKTVNDRFGHPTGDALLAAVGAALRDGVHPDAAVGRLGGEEFAVAISGLTPHEAETLGRRIRAVIASSARGPGIDLGDALPDARALHELLPVLRDWPVSASIGVATMRPTSTITVTRLVTLADHQLYEAKHSGRDQLRAAPALDPS